MTVYVVRSRDGELYGVFSTRELAMTCADELTETYNETWMVSAFVVDSYSSQLEKQK